jgi:serine/threonine-protein kinase
MVRWCTVVGTTFGSFRIIKQLGQGGMGAVYLAEHLLIGRKVAIKVLLPEFSSSPEMFTRFFNEARSTAQIHHPGLLDLFDFGYQDGQAYIVMEYLNGESLRDRIRRSGKLSFDLAIGVSRQLASAVGAAHALGVIHRDLKPENIFLLADAEVAAGLRAKVLDFGLAKLATESLSGCETKTGKILGTPLYMSPEQCKSARKVDHRADIYSLGCIMYEMVTGYPPFSGAGLAEIIAAQITEMPVSPRQSEPTLPPSLEAIILKALAKVPEERQQSMDELKQELDRASSGAFATGRHVLKLDGSVGTEETVAAVAVAGSSSVVDRALAPAATEIASAIPHATARTRKRKRRNNTAHTIALVGAALIFSGGVVYRLAAQGGGTVAQASTSPPPVVAPPPAIQPPAAAPPAVPAVVVPPSAPVPPSASATPAAEESKKVRLAIDSVPPGAEVWLGKNRVGTTPFESEVDKKEGEIEYVLKLAGYQNNKVTMNLQGDNSANVALKERAPVAPAKPKATPETTVKNPGGTLNPFDR